MKHIIFALLLFTLGAALPAPAAADAKADAAYLALVDAAQKDPAAADYAALRMAYSKTSFHGLNGGFEESVAPRKALENFHKQKTPEAAELLRKAVREYYGDVDTLLFLLHAENQNKTDALNTEAMGAALKGLLDAILTTGDGKSMKTALKTISTREEYAVAQGIYGMSIINRRIESGHGRIYSTLSVRSNQNPEMEMFFDVTDRWAHPANPARAEKPVPFRGAILTGDDTAADKEYLALVDSAMKNPEAADWAVLRKAYTATRYFAATGPLGATAFAQNTAQHHINRDTPESKQDFDAAYRHHFAAMGMHQIVEKLQAAGYLAHINKAIAPAARKGILQVALASGDGKTTATAFQVVTGQEIEQAVLQLLDKPASAGMSMEKDRFISAFKGIYRSSGAEAQYYFSLPGGLNAMMKIGAPQEARTPKDRSEADTRYLALAEAAIQSPATADYGALRMAYAQTSFYNPYGGPVVTRKMTEAAQAAAADPAKIESLKHSIKEHLAHFATHRTLLHFAANQKADFVDVKSHQAHLDGIIASIMKSGDGKSPQTAHHVIDIQEEYMVMRDIMKIKGQKRPTRPIDGHVYDVFDYQTADGTASAVYFNVDAIFARDPAE